MGATVWGTRGGLAEAAVAVFGDDLLYQDGAAKGMTDGRVRWRGSDLAPPPSVAQAPSPAPGFGTGTTPRATLAAQRSCGGVLLATWPNDADFTGATKHTAVYRARDGALLGELPAPTRLTSVTAAVPDPDTGLVLVTGSEAIAGADPAGGRLLWSRAVDLRAGSAVAEAVAFGGDAYADRRDGGQVRVDLRTGEEQPGGGQAPVAGLGDVALVPHGPSAGGGITVTAYRRAS